MRIDLPPAAHGPDSAGPASAGPARRAGRVLLVSGPSGSGKSTLCKRLLLDPRVEFSVSATTRPMRVGEQDGREYHFVSKERFRQLIEQGAFIEHAEVHGNLYGTLKEPMQRALENGRVYLVEIDVQGALQLRQLGIEGVYVFIDVPSMEVLRQRLVARGTDAPDVIARRLAKAEWERSERVKYDHVIVNDDLERSYAELLRVAGLDSPQRPDVSRR
jgi:guanylate kinase